MKFIRTKRVAVFLIACLFASIALSAPTEKPFLWRIEGSTPSYLYGTVHVPDQRVLDLPEVVRKAFDASDIIYTEIPLDAATQAATAARLMLPADQDLRKLAGDELFNRLVRAITKALGSNVPAGAADLVAASLVHMKPFAAMSQVELLDYLPDMMAGRQPLDVTLYGMAGKAGKQTGALETLDEQMAVIDSMTMEEQLKEMGVVLDNIEKPRPGELTVRGIVDLYLKGDLDPLAAELTKEEIADEALKKKFMKLLIDDRNVKMANRIADLCNEKPAKSRFFAIGALHYAGETGILAQLTKKGLKMTRLTGADAAAVRKPAA